MSRSAPVASVGRVTVLAPTTSSPYYRCTWIRADGKCGRTTGGRTLEDALAKAEAIEALESRAVGPGGYATLGEIAQRYLASPVGRNQKTGGDWKATQHRQVRHKLTRTLRGFEECFAAEYDRALADRMRAQAGTPNSVRENTTVLRGFVRWGAVNRYFTVRQAELLPHRCLDVAPSLRGTVAPNRREEVRDVGSSERYIREEDAPAIVQVVELGKQVEAILPGRGRLAVEFAADSGPRWGELFQLTAHDVVTAEVPFVRINWQCNDAATRENGQPRRIRPKGDKTRVTGLAESSMTGFPLRTEMMERRTHALREQADGLNPEALLFPTARGRMFWETEFHADVFSLAAFEAGWPFQDWVEEHDVWKPELGKYVFERRPRRQFVLTWHSLRHRFARYCVDTRQFSSGELMAAGGWENLATVENRYYRSGKEHQESALAKF